MTELGPLTIPLAAVRRELSQIRSWIQPREKHPFGEPEIVEQFGGQLRGLINSMDDELGEIESDLTNGRGSSAWERYARLQREDLPQLANELLAVIGGRYLSTRDLDDMHPLDEHDDRTSDTRTISFSNVARDLLNDLYKRTNAAVGSLLIVGEERQVPIGTGIVRLRFPACDVWNLPFTAHEYGYLVARSDDASPAFKQFRQQVEHYVDPRLHEAGDAEYPGDHPYRVDVKEFWRSVKLPEDRDEVPASLREMRARQTAHLCRLFADAFATYFVGPAYVQALLHLRFRPDKLLTEPGPMLPAFVERFVMALETLRRMNDDEARYRSLKFPHKPFDLVLDPSTGLTSIWTQFLESAGVRDDPYDTTAKRLKPWIDRIWRAVTDSAWRDGRNQATVYPCWQQTLKLVDVLKSNRLPHPVRPQPWAVVNAAWKARIDGGPELMIERVALRLLDVGDTGAVKPASEQKQRDAVDTGRGGTSQRDHPRQTSSPSAAHDGSPEPTPYSERSNVTSQPAANPVINDQIAVLSALIDRPDLGQMFNDSMANGDADLDILAFLKKDNPPAYRAYLRSVVRRGQGGDK